MDKRQELAMVQTAKHADWYATFAASEDRTVSGREREADLATVALANEVTKLRADIAADEELRDFLTLAITSGVEVV